jgi:hypothetical protein
VDDEPRHLLFEGRAELDGLFLCALLADVNLAQESVGIIHWEGDDVRGPVVVEELSVELLDSGIVRQNHGYGTIGQLLAGQHRADDPPDFGEGKASFAGLVDLDGCCSLFHQIYFDNTFMIQTIATTKTQRF